MPALDARNRSKEDGARRNRLMAHLQHPVADVEGPQPPQEVKPAQALLTNGLCICGPVHFIV